MMGFLSGIMISSLISHGKVESSSPDRGAQVTPSVELGSWLFLELGKERRSGLMQTISHPVVLTGQRKIWTLIPYSPWMPL